MLFYLVQEHLIHLLGGKEVALLPVGGAVHHLAVFLKRDTGGVHVAGCKNVGVDHDIAGDIEEIRVAVVAARAMQEGTVQHLVHHDEFQLSVAYRIQKIGAEIHTLAVRGGGFALLVQRHCHMHQQDTVKAVRAEQMKAGKQQAP